MELTKKYFNELKNSDKITKKDLNGIEWYYITNINQIGVGISQNGNWVIAKNNYIFELTDKNSTEEISWLPLLECDYNFFLEEFKKGILATSQTIDINLLIDTFPLQNLVMVGLTSNTESWTLSALDWVEHLKVSDKILQQLTILQNEDWASQQLRHKAKRLYHYLRKGNVPN